MEDALKNDAFPDFLEVQKRSLQVTTNRSLVTVYAKETERCQKLNQMQRNEDRTVFQNIFGERFKFTRAHENQGRKVKSYFSHWPSEAKNHVSPYVSEAHEEAVAHAGRLVLKDQLRVVKLCGHSSHKQVELAEQWVPQHRVHNCVEAIQVGCVASRTTEAPYRWETPEGRVFVLDLVRAP